MKTLLTPTHAWYNADRKTSTLFFPDETSEEYHIRGGLCWAVPVATGATPRVEGFACVLALDIRTRIVYVLAERRFVSIDHVIGELGRITHEGVSTFFNSAWHEYFCSTWYYHQCKETTKMYRLQVGRSKMIQPKPQFVHVPWSDDAIAENTVWQMGNRNLLRPEHESETHLALKMAPVQIGQVSAPLMALTAGLNGLERFPWREPR